MDAIRVAKVDNVLLDRGGTKIQGTLHLTAHHLIFVDPSGKEPEIWTPYPLINLLTRLPLTHSNLSPLHLRLRTFTSLLFLFAPTSPSLPLSSSTHDVAEEVFLSLRDLTVASSVDSLHCFHYVPTKEEAEQGVVRAGKGWGAFNPREEFGRMGVGGRSRAWRFTDINKDYQYSPTYPAKLVVPAKISDSVLAHSGKYRSKARIPALSYLHWGNFASITRCSQPMVGLKNNRSTQDERLVDSIFLSHIAPSTSFSPALAELTISHSTTADPLAPSTASGTSTPTGSEQLTSSGLVYGATSTNLLVDARPTANAMANVAKGAGTENMEYYKNGRKVYLGIDNIHVMRDSLNRVVEVLRDAEVGGLGQGGQGMVDRLALRRSGWLKHLTAILEGTLLIVRNIHINSSHVLIHCSDGWDRTAQLSSAAQICLDPYFRTIKGFMVLVEKDWLAFGHKFLDRCGHLSSEKLFTALSEKDRLREQEEGEDGGGTGGELAEGVKSFLGAVRKQFAGNSHIKETSPVFHQFLDCVRQMQRQFPERFEYNGKFLEEVHYQLYACRFGTFVFNNERQRRTVGEDGEGLLPTGERRPPWERTVSVWDWLGSPAELPRWLNEAYDKTLDDPTRKEGDMGVLLVNPKDVRYWHELFKRGDEEMNGPVGMGSRGFREGEGQEVVGPITTAEGDPVVGASVGEVMKSVVEVAAASPIVASGETKVTARDLGGVTGQIHPGTSPYRAKPTELPDHRTPYSTPSYPSQSDRSSYSNAYSSHPSSSTTHSNPIPRPLPAQTRPTRAPTAAASGGWGWSQLGTGALSAIQSAAKELKSLGNDAFAGINGEGGEGRDGGEMWTRGSEGATGSGDARSETRYGGKTELGWNAPSESIPKPTRIPSEANPWNTPSTISANPPRADIRTRIQRQVSGSEDAGASQRAGAGVDYLASSGAVWGAAPVAQERPVIRPTETGAGAREIPTTLPVQVKPRTVTPVQQPSKPQEESKSWDPLGAS